MRGDLLPVALPSRRHIFTLLLHPLALRLLPRQLLLQLVPSATFLILLADSLGQRLDSLALLVQLLRQCSALRGRVTQLAELRVLLAQRRQRCDIRLQQFELLGRLVQRRQLGFRLLLRL